MVALLRILFVILVAYPVTLLWLGISLRHRERLPTRGPAIIVANHNSHLDILTLYSLFPLLRIPDVRPAAAADYFMKTGLMSWFSRNVVGIIPVERGGAKRGADPLTGCYQALEQGKILIIFPEGTRGEPERMAELKSGIWHLARRFPDIPVVPVYLHGLGRSMPKGQFVPIPFFVTAYVGKPLPYSDDKATYMTALHDRFGYLKDKVTAMLGAAGRELD